uniref:Uncharacterized protein n=1 Tax=Caenorhabditis japonica TaxID=281687 RepID=A0A8R1EG93_CAEJA
ISSAEKLPVVPIKEVPEKIVLEPLFVTTSSAGGKIPLYPVQNFST